MNPAKPCSPSIGGGPSQKTTTQVYEEAVQSIASTACIKRADGVTDDLDVQIKNLVKVWVIGSRKLLAEEILACAKYKPTAQEIEARIKSVNPFGVHNRSQKLRYAAWVAMEADCLAAGAEIIAERQRPSYWRLHDPAANAYLTCAEVEPDCPEADDDKVYDFTDEKDAHDARLVYERSMAQIGLPVSLRVIGFNKHGEVVGFEPA